MAVRTEIINFKVTPDEKFDLEQRARDCGLNMPSYIRLFMLPPVALSKKEHYMDLTRRIADDYRHFEQHSENLGKLLFE